MLGAESDTHTQNCSTIRLKSSKPIPIPKNPSLQNLIDDLDDNECKNIPSLSGNFFNPQKFSPPDIWKNRLKDRIKNHLGSSIINVKIEK